MALGPAKSDRQLERLAWCQVYRFIFNSGLMWGSHGITSIPSFLSSYGATDLVWFRFSCLNAHLCEQLCRWLYSFRREPYTQWRATIRTILMLNYSVELRGLWEPDSRTNTSNGSQKCTYIIHERHKLPVEVNGLANIVPAQSHDCLLV